MKHNFDWKKVVVFFLVAAGLIFITRSFFMSLGILILLLIADYFIAAWNEKKRTKEEIDRIINEHKA